MKFPKVLSLLLMFLSVKTYAQSDLAAVTDVTPAILTWMKHLNNEADKYLIPEKISDLSLHFGQLKQNLSSYMKARKSLSDSLLRNNIKPGNKNPDNLEMLKTKMGAVMEQMRNVADLASNNLRREGDNLNEQIYDILYGQEGHYLSNLEAFLAGLDVSKRDLAVNGSASYSRLEECVNLISAIQGKIERKK
ncbi:MAG TPA: hypothetical protein VM802_15995 [Chitinophaga sp.]|uniref:hypothetical protein n=1 Tax=Chitinophaga sp. TaxID=1869181 RepID=UPI002C3E4511|nr:hypothetical protein [Chitinophaga sp.]HVI46377.1 hypothetical protein [Chitinophaga sp.]